MHHYLIRLASRPRRRCEAHRKHVIHFLKEVRRKRRAGNAEHARDAAVGNVGNRVVGNHVVVHDAQYIAASCKPGSANLAAARTRRHYA